MPHIPAAVFRTIWSRGFKVKTTHQPRRDSGRREVLPHQLILLIFSASRVSVLCNFRVPEAAQDRSSVRPSVRFCDLLWLSDFVVWSSRHPVQVRSDRATSSVLGSALLSSDRRIMRSTGPGFPSAPNTTRLSGPTTQPSTATGPTRVPSRGGNSSHDDGTPVQRSLQTHIYSS